MEDSVKETYQCSEDGCSVGTNGKCVNGLAPDDCPNRISVVKKKSTNNKSEKPDTPDLVFKKLPWGGNFKEDEVSSISYQYPCKLILVVGEPSSGKSTLYAALFDSFHKGGCGDYIFASTRTPIGFEEICHLAREKCKGKTPKTERTKSWEFTYLHLAVKHKNLEGSPEHLIFADVNGERFQSAKNDDEQMQKLSVMKMADQIFFVADGELLTIDGDKHVVKKDMWNIVNRCIQNDMISSAEGVSLVITKWDKIQAANKTKDVDKFFIKPTLKKFENTIGQLIKVASRSLNKEVPPRYGVDDFLKLCLSNKVVKPDQPKYTPPLKRQFQFFKYEER